VWGCGWGVEVEVEVGRGKETAKVVSSARHAPRSRSRSKIQDDNSFVENLKSKRKRR
jgi:hypothetical protein